MSAQELIQSGKLELYVAGALSPREMGDMAVLAQDFPEVANEIQRIEQAMVIFLSPAEFCIAVEEKERQIDVILGRITYGEDKNVARQMNGGGKVFTLGRLLIAALIAGWILICCVATWMGVKNRDFRQEVAYLQGSRETLDVKNQAYQQQLGHVEQQVSMMRNIITKRIELTTVAGNKITGLQNYMLVYWNPGTKKLLLVDANLPDLSSDQQYQLWALYDGKPIDAGVFDYFHNQLSVGFQKDVPNAQAFAVTVEPKGGSASPTLSNLCMMGKL